MSAGYYCTVVRGRKVGWLLGLVRQPSARAMLPDARRLAYEADPRTHFDAFGTARLEREGTLPQGVLNEQLSEGF